MKRFVLLAAFTALLAGSAHAATNPTTPRTTGKAEAATELQTTLKDIETTLGSVPRFFRLMPDAALPGAWAMMKNVQLNPNSAIPAKYKELIGLGVSAQIPCRYCTYFHTEAARVNGATDQEIKEALALAGSERAWSAIVNGARVSDDTARGEADKFVAHAQKMLKQPAPAMPMAMPTDAAGVRAAMEQNWGMVPKFVEHIPESGLVGFWSQVMGLDFNPASAIPPKYKSMLNYAVSSQVPCRTCLIYDHAIATKVDGASQRELDEAVAVAAIVRQWSTVLNGSLTDEAQFRRDADNVMGKARAKMARPAGPGTQTPPTGKKVKDQEKMREKMKSPGEIESERQEP